MNRIGQRVSDSAGFIGNIVSPIHVIVVVHATNTNRRPVFFTKELDIIQYIQYIIQEAN